MKIQDTIICEESWIFLTHGQVTRSWTTTWSIEQRPFIKNPRYFSCMIRLSDHKPQASHRNKDHLRNILDIFHTRASYLVMNHRLVVRAETIPGKFWIFFTHGQVTRSRATGQSLEQRSFMNNPRYISRTSKLLDHEPRASHLK
jgi:hypothetical protein